MVSQLTFEHPEQLTGKHVLIDLTVCDFNEKVVEKKQLYGKIVGASGGRGIEVELLPSGEPYYLPPDLNIFETMPAGNYRLEPSGDIAIDPELRVTFLVHLPPPEFEGTVIQEP